MDSHDLNGFMPSITAVESTIAKMFGGKLNDFVQWKPIFIGAKDANDRRFWD